MIYRFSIYTMLFSLLICNSSFAEQAQKDAKKSKVSKKAVDEKQNSSEIQTPQEQPVQEKIEQNEIEQGPELELLDQIESTVTYTNAEKLETSIITKQDILKRGFDGGQYTVKDLEDEELADQLSKFMKASISNDDVNKNLKKNGLTDKQIEELSKSWGFSCKDDLFEYFKKIYRATGALNFEVESQLVSTQGEIEQYYSEHTNEFEQDAIYNVEISFIQNTQQTLAGIPLKDELEQYVQGKIKAPEYVYWENPVDIKSSEISSFNDFLVDLEIGSIYLKEFPDGYTLYKMKNKIPKKILSCKEVSQPIAAKIRRTKYESAASKAKEKLRKSAIIVRPSEEYKVPETLEDIGIKEPVRPE